MRTNYIVAKTYKGNALTIKVTSETSAYYQINNGEWSRQFASREDAEKDAIVSKLESEGLSKEKDDFEIKRSKGLGENQPEMMWETTMNPETRRLIKVMPDDVEKTREMFELLLGDNLAGRKEHIAENGYKYIDFTDLM